MSSRADWRLRGLLLASILAAAMSSTDSAMNSLAAVTLEDIAGIPSASQPVRLSRLTPFCWGIFAVAAGLFFARSGRGILELINQIGSAFYGPVLAAFALAVARAAVREYALIGGVLAGLATNIALSQFAPQVSWLWWNPAGFASTVLTAFVISRAHIVLPRWNAPKHEAAILMFAFISILTFLFVLNISGSFLHSSRMEAHGAGLPLQLLVIFVSAKIFAEILERLGMPGIVGEIIAGITIGPSVLGFVHPNEVLTTLAELGVMFLLFRVGLEVKSSQLFGVGVPALLIAVLGVIAPFILGWGIAALWGKQQIESIFIAAAMVATSVGITAQVLASKGLLQERASQLILAAAIIDDVLGLLILALVSSVARGSVNVIELVATALVAIVFTVIIATLGTHAMKKIVPKVDSFHVAEAQFAFSVSLLFGLAVVAIYAGVAAIIGAFLAGMALAEHVSHRVHDLTNGVTELLVPFFLVGIGLHFELAAFADSSLVLFAVVILIAAIVSKLVGCGLGALSFGKGDALRVGVGMIPRGEVGMVVAQLGLSLAVISGETFGIVVFMSVMTTIVAPPLLTWAYKDLIVTGKGAEGIRIG